MVKHQRAHAAEAVGDGAPEEGEAPADQKQGEQQAAVESDVAPAVAAMPERGSRSRSAGTRTSA